MQCARSTVRTRPCPWAATPRTSGTWTDPGRVPGRGLPLAATYVIAERRDDVTAPATITGLKGHEALIALVARTYTNYVLDSTLRVRALTVFARLAAQVPIRQLIVRHDADNLGALTDAILADLASL